MDGFAVVLGLLIAGAVIAFLTWPWRMQRAGLQPDHSPETPLAWDAQDEALDDQYEAVLTALRDLDFDHAVGKVAEEDYAPLRQALLVKAAGVMTQLDERDAAEADVEARLEAWLVKAGKHSPCRDGLHLRERVGVRAALDAVEAAQPR